MKQNKISRKQKDGQKNLKEEVLKERVFCPNCNSLDIKKNGLSKDGSQRYLCKNKDCPHPSFNTDTGTPFSGLRKSVDLFIQFIHCTLQKNTLRGIQRKLGVHRNTVFIWRHKVLSALLEIDNDTKVSGSVNTSLTTIPTSRKGKKIENVKPRKRGGKHEKEVNILNFKDLQGNVVSKSISIGEIEDGKMLEVMELALEEECIIYTDIENENIFPKVSEGCEVAKVSKHKYRVGDTKTLEWDIQSINKYSKELKALIIDNFNGVATKYIDHYLILNKLIDQLDEKMKTREELVNEIMKKCGLSTKTLKVREFEEVKPDFEK